MSAPNDTKEVSSSLSELKLSTTKETPKPKPTKKKAKKVVADSWEDEDVSDSDPESEPADKDEDPAQAPTSRQDAQFDWPSAADSSSARAVDSEKRPEKTDAVARRMIAAGLGLKAPKLTDEQRAYQKSVREQEKRKREAERALEQKKRDDAEKAKAAMWDD